MTEYIERETAVEIIKEKQKELCPVGRYGRGYVCRPLALNQQSGARIVFTMSCGQMAGQ